MMTPEYRADLKWLIALQYLIEEIQVLLKKSCIILYQIVWEFNSLLDNRILDWSKLKQIADDILKCIQNEK